AGGTAVPVCRATRPADPHPTPLVHAVPPGAAAGDGVEVTWAGDGARSVVRFRPMSVSLL
ncbi:hypothetical protein ACFV3F_21095, partial [Streptomyces sp. NPDC059717]|uniref:hypothetical protein n=1 Tax=Streptomyces sp. NPDC059717 TaxID=3346922 RepID=UPI0036ADEEF9